MVEQQETVDDRIEPNKDGGVNPDEIDNPPLMALNSLVVRRERRSNEVTNDPLYQALASSLVAHRDLVAALKKEGQSWDHPSLRALRMIINRAGARINGSFDKGVYRALENFLRNGGARPEDVDEISKSLKRS